MEAEELVVAAVKEGDWIESMMDPKPLHRAASDRSQAHMYHLLIPALLFCFCFFFQIRGVFSFFFPNW